MNDFLDDQEKMEDYYRLPKEEFLRSYSYLTEEEYDLTARKATVVKNALCNVLKETQDENISQLS